MLNLEFLKLNHATRHKPPLPPCGHANASTRFIVMVAAMAMRVPVGDGNDDNRQPRPRNNNNHATAAERAIMGTIDPDDNVADFIFQDENGQLVQQRFLQFLNS